MVTFMLNILKRQNYTKTFYMKYGGSSIMLRGCFTYSSVGFLQET